MMHRSQHRRSKEPEKIHPTNSGSSPSIRLLIADGEEVTRIGMRTILEGEPDFLILGETCTMADTLSKARLSNVDVVLLESEFSDGSGAEACRRLIENNPSIRVIMLTMSDAPSIFHGAIEAGVHGFVLKDVCGTELTRLIRIVAGGASYLHSEMVGRAFSVLRDRPEPGRGAGLHRLSPQERRILPLVAEGKTNKEIALEMSLSDKTVKNYLLNLFKKLGITRRTQAAVLYMQTQRLSAEVGV